MRDALDIERLKAVYGRLAGRYDTQHALITARSDQKGRRLLVEEAVRPGDEVLDCGAGTGSTGLMAAARVGSDGGVTLFDLSEEMLAVAERKASEKGLLERIATRNGDLTHLPYEDGTFDVVLSTYSLCPVQDPRKSALEMLRVVKPGGRLGIAHSSEPENRVMRWIADRVEDLAWRFSWLSMGCRSVDVLSALEEVGAQVVFKRRIGVPLWPFFVFIVEKPTTAAPPPPRPRARG